MIDAAAIGTSFANSMDHSHVEHYPYDYWVLDHPLPDGAGESVVDLPIEAAQIEDTAGRRETNNATRVHFAPAQQARFPVVRAIAEAFQSEQVVRKLEEKCGVDLRGSLLRIEYCQDRGGFWLEPHTDIGAKLFTMMIFLCEGEGAEDWGTDVLDAERNLVARAPCGFNIGMIFIPGENTWHSFQERPIKGVRRSLMVNYVKDEWRSTHELSFPGQPVQ
jgi:hypothetical protein